jgi:uncharacterized protein
MISQELLDILVCPKCKQAMEYHPAENKKDGAFHCTHCQLSYAVVDDLPNFIIEEATPLEEGNRQ